MKIVIAGATGLIGKALTKKLIDNGEDVIIFSRNIAKSKELIPNAKDHIEWRINGSTNPQVIDALKDADAVINLAGENVLSRRWTKKHKENIYNSRVKGTRKLTEAILKSNNTLKTYISASAVGIYGSRDNNTFEDSETGNDFLANVVKDWESASSGLEKFNTRRVHLRIGIVLSTEEGALKKLLLPFKLFVGGPLGNGKQWFPWIHIDDVVELFLYSIYNSSVEGAVNTASPNPLRMKEFCKVLGKTIKRPSFFNVPSIALKILFGEGGDVLLTGAKVLPKRAVDFGYKFKFENAEKALENLLNK